MHRFFILFLFFSPFYTISEARSDPKKLPFAVITGSVYCDTCFQDDSSWNSHFISGASVAVECKGRNFTGTFKQEVKTDENGEFKVELPILVRKHVKKMERCRVKLLRSNHPNCAVASMAKSSSLRLKSRQQGMHIFSAGFLSFRPQNQPVFCNQKPSLQNFETLNSRLPPLPKLPPLSHIKLLFRKKLLNSDGLFPTPPVFPPNPFQPPSVFPPNPFQPPPLLPPIPNPFQPPPAPLIPLPPIPGLTPPPPPPLIPNLPPILPLPPFLFPSPPPPPPPLIPKLPPLIPLPPFPFPPPSPGVPPASSSTKTSP